MTAESGGSRVDEILNPPAQSVPYVHKSIYLVGVLFAIIILPRVRKEGRKVRGEGYFDSAGGCWTTRTPAMRAGLKDRSQSAYAAPAPKPVERAMGHVRPGAIKIHRIRVDWQNGLSRTTKEDDGCDNTDAEADTTARGNRKILLWHRRLRVRGSRRTILLANPPLAPRAHRELVENTVDKERTITYSSGHTVPVSAIKLCNEKKRYAHLLSNDVLTGNRFWWWG